VTDRKFTAFEIRLDDATFTAREGEAGAATDRTAAADVADDGGCLAGRAATVLLVLAALAAVVAARTVGDDALDDLADLDDVA
jgi:hypothetical protein